MSIDFSQAFYSIHRGKIEQVVLIYRLPIETVIALEKYESNGLLSG